MKQYKQLELWLNISLLTGLLLYFLVVKNFTALLLGYFLFGTIQSFSVLLHIFKGWFSNHLHRKIYYWILSGVLVATLLTMSLYALVYISPLIALYYIFLSYKEYQILQLKEFVHLK